MNYVLFISIFSALGIFYFILGMLASKTVKTKSDYFLAGRNLGIWPVTFTLIATQIGGGMLLGTAEQSYQIGYYGIMYTFGMVLGFLLLGLGFASKLQSLKVATTAELFETRYFSPNLKKMASLLSIATMFGILVAQIVASRTLIMGLDMTGGSVATSELLLLFFWAFVIIYTITGGLKAVVLTDSIQIIFIIILFIGIFLYGLSGEASSFFSLSSIASQQKLFVVDSRSIFASSISIVFMTALFALIEQDLAQRFFASRTKKIAAISATLASIFLLLFSLVPIYFGIKAKLLGICISGSPLIPIIKLLTNEIVLILAVCGIIAAITSTGDSLLCAISSNISQDFDLSKIGIRNTLTLPKIVTLIAGTLAVIASYFVPQDIISVLIGSYEISVSCLLVPLLFSYFKKNLNKNAAIGSILFGLLGFVLFRIYPIAFREIVTLLLSLAGYFVGNKIRRGKQNI